MHISCKNYACVGSMHAWADKLAELLGFYCPACVLGGVGKAVASGGLSCQACRDTPCVLPAGTGVQIQGLGVRHRNPEMGRSVRADTARCCAMQAWSR